MRRPSASLIAMTMLPGPRSPMFWQTARFLFDEQRWLDRCRARYGDVFKVKLSSVGDLVEVCDPDLIKQVFTGDPETLHAGEGNRVLLPIVGPMSVLLLDEQPHLRERKLLLPAFHGERMKVYERMMLEATDREVDRWPIGQRFELHPAMQQITLEAILGAVFGIAGTERFTRLEWLLRRFLDVGTKVTLVTALQRNLGSRSPWVRFKRLRAQVDELIYDEIRNRRDDPATAERDDVLSLMLQARTEDGEPMEDSEVRDELLTMLVAGHETTATSLAWAFERLLRHPGELERLRASISAGEQDYLEAVIKETMRVRPVLGYAMRRVKKPYRLGEFEIPQGAQIGVSVYLTHMRPDIYPDPQSFRPQRFIDQPSETYSWLAFGGGIRRCLGASFAMYEMKTVLARILERCELRAPERRDERVRRRAITYVPAKGSTVVLDRREPVGAPRATADTAALAS